MTTKKDVCCYGLHFGCLNATSPDCRTCAEHLTRAVNYTVHEATTGHVGTHNEGGLPIEGATRSRRVISLRLPLSARSCS